MRDCFPVSIMEALVSVMDQKHFLGNGQLMLMRMLGRSDLSADCRRLKSKHKPLCGRTEVFYVYMIPSDIWTCIK
jgi:hypothetical protein